MGRRHRDEGALDELYWTASPRKVAWSAVAVLALATAGFAYTQRPTVPPATYTRLPDHVYGMPLPADSGFGHDAYCTDFEFVPSTTQWRCDVVAVNVNHLPVDHATAYVGSCGHIAVLDTRWACIDGSAPVPAQAPPAPITSA